MVPTALPAPPTERSTIAVRNAVAILKAEGLVEGRRGAGVYVRDVRRLVRHTHARDMRSSTGSTSPFARDAGRAGHRGGWRHTSDRATADLDVARRLNIEPDDPVMRTQYLFLADDEP